MQEDRRVSVIVLYTHPLFGEGIAYVGVSAQAAGIEGGGAVIEVPGVPAVAGQSSPRHVPACTGLSSSRSRKSMVPSARRWPG